MQSKTSKFIHCTVTVTRQYTLRWPSVPNFPGKSRFLTTCPGKNSYSGTPICPFLAWCPGFVPTLTNCAISPYECQYLSARAWFHLCNVYRKKSLAAGALPRTPLGEITTLSIYTPKLDHDGSRMWRANSRTLVRDCSAQIMVTLMHMPLVLLETERCYYAILARTVTLSVYCFECLPSQ